MKTLVFLAVLVLTACGPAMTVMHNPNTGQTVHCQAFTNQYGTPMDQGQRENCVMQYQMLGFVAVNPQHAVTVQPN